jgi:hypothetical protein
MVERLTGRKSVEGQGGLKDRQLSDVEQREQARALLAEFRGAMQSTPEVQQELAYGYFNPDVATRNFDDGNVFFYKGGQSWHLYYDKGDAGNEELSLTRQIKSRDGMKVLHEDKVSLGIWEEQGDTRGSLIGGGKIATEFLDLSSSVLDYDQKPTIRRNTNSAVITAKGFLQEFLLAGK